MKVVILLGSVLAGNMLYGIFHCSPHRLVSVAALEVAFQCLSSVFTFRFLFQKFPEQGCVSLVRRFRKSLAFGLSTCLPCTDTFLGFWSASLAGWHLLFPFAFANAVRIALYCRSLHAFRPTLFASSSCSLLRTYMPWNISWILCIPRFLQASICKSVCLY